MHRPVCITYDSTCDLTPALLERFAIRTVPLTIQSGERVFPDDGSYTSADLYAEYRKAKADMQEVTTSKANIDYLLGYSEPGRKKEQER